LKATPPSSVALPTLPVVAIPRWRGANLRGSRNFRPGLESIWGLPFEIDPKTAAALRISSGDMVRVGISLRVARSACVCPPRRSPGRCQHGDRRWAYALYPLTLPDAAPTRGDLAPSGRKATPVRSSWDRPGFACARAGGRRNWNSSSPTNGTSAVSREGNRRILGTPLGNGHDLDAAQAAKPA